MDFSEKIKLIRQSEGITQSKLAELSGVGLSTIKRFEVENRDITISTVDKLLRHSSIQKYALWFLTGSTAKESGQVSPDMVNFYDEGEKYIDDYESAKDDKWTLSAKSSEEVVQLYKSQNEGVSKLRGLLDPNRKKVKDTTSKNIVSVPFFQLEPVEQGSCLTEQKERSNLISFETEWLRKEVGVNPNDVFLMLVDDDSMNPTLKEETMIMVDRHIDNHTNGIYVLRFNGELLIKRLHFTMSNTIKVISDNNIYPQEEINKEQLTGTELELIGRVVWSGQRV